MKRLVIGILAHVDSGKTTLSEGMLYCAGVLRKLGRVDHGDAFLDTDSQERARGITIFSKQAVLPLADCEITLLDTPGHVDFSPETERTLRVLDYAILVISGTDGVQSHTETLWRLLQRHGVPTFLFINKMDLPGPGQQALMEELQNRLSGGCVDFTDLNSEAAQEQLALCREDWMETYLEAGEVPLDTLPEAIKNRDLFPCCFGSALKLEGVSQFLRVLEQYTVSPVPLDGFGAKVFKIARDDQGVRLTYLKITGGTLPVKSMLKGVDKNGEPWEEKVGSIRVYSGAKFSAVQEALPGMVCAITGLSHTYPGMGLGEEPLDNHYALQPVLTYRVNLPEGCDIPKVLGQFRQLEEEEPQLHVNWNENLQELRVQLMGQVQLEILETLLISRFGLEVTFEQGSIIYLETIADAVEGVGHFEPLRHYAEVHLLLEPGSRGSGLVFSTDCDQDYFARHWQNLVLTHLLEKQHVGVLTGSPITDMRITLVSGKAHIKHSEGGDFRQATYRALRQGLMEAESILLEPWYSYRLEVPTESVGRAMADLQRMHGEFQQEKTTQDSTVLVGRAPVAQMRDYPLEVAGYTHGKGRISYSFDGYAPCQEQEAVVAAFGYDPEADLENTPDSVFCSHGAGTVVKWYDVKEHMHLPAVLSPAPDAEEVEKSWAQRAAEYCKIVATDKELMAIFERTYGPIRRNTQTAMRTPKSPKTSEKRKKYPQPPSGPEYLLVDGYNIIFAWEDLTTLARERLELARDALIEMLSNYQGVAQCELILVFDAYKVKGGKGSVEKVGNISVVYTKEAETADMYIERVTHQIGKGKKVRVATSDGLVQMIILGHGALRVPARILRQEVDAAQQAVWDYLDKQERS